MSNSSQSAGRAPVPAVARKAADSNRRRFLLALGAGGAGAAAAATQAVANPVLPAAAPAEAESGYRETDHVRDYYATTRI
jgi:hypothetical protein